MAQAYKRKCVICGKDYISQREYGKYCSYDCKKVFMKAYDEERRRKRKEEAAVKIKYKSLAVVSAGARAVGMTYGQYVALKMAGGTKE